MTAPRVILKLIRRVQRRSAWCAAVAALPRILWVAAIVITLLLPVHFFYVPVDVWSTTLAAILISILWFVRAYAVTMPTRDQAACIADRWYDGKSLMATAIDLDKRSSRELFANLVAENARQNAKIWLADPHRMPSPGFGWRIWLPATIAATGVIFLLIPGFGPGHIHGLDAPGERSTGPTTAAASLLPGTTVDSLAPRQEDQITGQLRAWPMTEESEPSEIAAAMTAPDALQGTPSAAITGSGDLPGADSDDMAFADTGVVLPASDEIEIPASGDRSQSTVTGTMDVNELSVRYGPAQAQYAAAYFRELGQQGRRNEQQ